MNKKFFKKIEDNSDYITNHLIAYIGNKRKLINLIVRSVQEVIENGNEKIDINGLFIDYFAGSGVVSRLAKSLGFKVISNDWEYYSYTINRSFLELNEDFLKEFADEEGIETLLEKINSLPNDPKKPYISKYYCPEKDDEVDTEKERIFYTQANGKQIDKIREEIESLYENKTDKKSIQKKNLLLALLLYQSSLRSNTNGVFKGFHKGFGGTKGDALSRILAPVNLQKPFLSKSKKRCKVFRSDANQLVKKMKKFKAEIVYLDPPYNQHQYGSNYHLLNTIALNDQPSIQKEFLFNNKKIKKSGIREDWQKTKSLYCYRKTAKEKFRNLIENIYSKYILVSYSTEGIIEFDDMLDLLVQKGKIGIVTESYVRYRGGKQANTTTNKNVEFILMVDTSLQSTQKDIDNVKKVLLQNCFNNLSERTFAIDKFFSSHCSNSSNLNLSLKNLKEIYSNKINTKEVEVKKNKKKYEVALKDYDFTFNLNDRFQIEKKSFIPIFQKNYKEQKQIFSLLEKQCLYKDHRSEVAMLKKIVVKNNKNTKVDVKYLKNRIEKLHQKYDKRRQKKIKV